jgi:N4-(beta-N-acetylglucosaminyl)-L-asparaginase
MRQGAPPEEACRKAIERVVKKHGDKAKELQVGFIALNKQGEFGGYCVAKGFTFPVMSNEGEKIFEAKSWF